MQCTCTLWISVFLIICGIPWGCGHGYLMEPPQRSSLWRHGFGGQENYNDNGLNCGGMKRQWTQNGGKCGICGDAYDLPPPRPNEDGGVYGRGIIMRTYRSGDVIDAIVNLTANHLGWIEFRLCPHDKNDQTVTQECLDKTVLRIMRNSISKKSTNRLYVGKSHLITMKIKLPHNLSCRKCVLQWKYNAGNSWGCDDTGCGIGFGQQEQFYNCADISILQNVKIIQRDSSEESSEESTPTRSKASKEDTSESSDDDKSFIAKYELKGEAGSLLEAVTEKTKLKCKPTKRWRTVPGMKKWCLQTCPKCPSSHCICK